MLKAVFFDFGGVILSSPFTAFAEYERQQQLPEGFITTLNTTNPDDNAWAKFERSEVDADGFARLFEAEACELGHTVDGAHIVSLLSGSVRPEMVRVLESVKAAGLITACLTNNFAHPDYSDQSPTESKKRAEVRDVMARFDHLVQSSKIGVRKPESEFYEYALALAGVEPAEVVFLDDLGMNLKPARAMGMTTIKVTDPRHAIAELSEVLGLTFS